MRQLKMLVLMWLVFFVGILWRGYPLRTAIIAPSITVAILGMIALFAWACWRWEDRQLAAAIIAPPDDLDDESEDE